MMARMRVVVSQFEGIDATPVLPLAAGCLVAAARVDPELGGAARLSIALERQPIERAVAAYDDPAVLGFSLYPWNTAYSLAVAAAARVAYPGCLIVAGGPSVPRRPERARRFLDDHPAVDALVFAEGELTFRELLRAHLHGAALDAIPGIALRRGPGRAEHQLTAPPGRSNRRARPAGRNTVERAAWWCCPPVVDGHVGAWGRSNAGRARDRSHPASCRSRSLRERSGRQGDVERPRDLSDRPGARPRVAGQAGLDRSVPPRIELAAQRSRRRRR